MYDRIVVPVPEGAGPDTLDRPRALARVLDCTLSLLHVHRPQEAPSELEGLPQYRYQHVVESWDRRDGEAEAQESKWLESLADEVARRDPELKVDSRVVQAPLSRCVHCDTERVLAMVPVRGAGEPALDDTGREIIRTCGVPVLLVRPEMDLLPIRRILVALDGSPFSRESLGPAIDLARSTGARITLLEVVTRHNALVRMLHPAERTTEAAERSLREVAQQIPPALGRTELKVIEHENAVGGILSEAGRGDIDLLAMATHGRGGLRRLVMGSVAERVIESSPVPVLVFRPQALRTEAENADREARALA